MSINEENPDMGTREERRGIREGRGRFKEEGSRWVVKGKESRKGWIW